MKARNPNLDALRGIAILLVLGRHFPSFGAWYRIGWSGVDLFFVLSGFLISGLLFSEWKDRGAIDVKRFYIRRAFKIYPSFYVYLLVSAAVMLLNHTGEFRMSWQSFGAETLFLQNYLISDLQSGIWGHTWSLAIEEHFYLVFPLVLWLMLLVRPRKLDPFRWMPVLFVVIAALALWLRFRVGLHVSGPQYAVYYFPTHLRCDALAFGVLLAYLRQFRPRAFAAFSSRWLSALCIAIASAALFVFPLESPAMHTIGFTVVYLGFGCLLAATVDRSLSRFHRIIQPLAKIGVYSYSIYLWHYPFSFLIPRHAEFFPLYLAVSIGFGAYSAKNLEFWALAIRDRLYPAAGAPMTALRHEAVIARAAA